MVNIVGHNLVSTLKTQGLIGSSIMGVHSLTIHNRSLIQELNGYKNLSHSFIHGGMMHMQSRVEIVRYIYIQ